MPCSMADRAIISPTSALHSTTASLSREPPGKAPIPDLVHTLHQELSSVLSVAADEKHIFSGSQGYDIFVWDRRSFSVKTTLRGHTGSVLALEIAIEKSWLFSSSGDSTIRIWSTKSLTPLFVLNPYLDTDAGDLFSLAYSPTLQTLYFGCQNTSLQWFTFKNRSPSQTLTPNPNLTTSDATADLPLIEFGTPKTPPKHKFFDSFPQPQGRPTSSDGLPVGVGLGLASGQTTPRKDDVPQPLGVLQVPVSNVIDSAHFGYVYSMALLPSTLEGTDSYDKGGKQILLVTGSGDETVKLWICTPAGPTLVHTFEGCAGAVLSIVARHGTVYGGCQDGQIKVWDLETKTLVRTIIAQEGVDVLSLSMIDKDLYSCSANGQIQRWSASFDCTASWSAHDGIVLSSIITQSLDSDTWYLVTGANDNCIKLWKISRPRTSLHTPADDESENECTPNEKMSSQGTLAFALSKFVSIPSVSNSSANREDCRQAAIWLKKCLAQLGAESNMLPTADGRNPLVLATFHGTQNKTKRPRILFYGHYDVISAPPEGWNSDPFTLTGRNGYFYGRGVTDNKGPILAVACAVSEMLSRRTLGCDVVFLIEGEEEAGSVGFSDAVKRHKDIIGRVDSILVSNSTWIAEDRPCITYGLRGVVHASIDISSDHPDLHSGIEGGAVAEPMVDMIKLLATLSDGPKVLIPKFYDKVRRQTDEEKQLYEVLSSIINRPASSLSSRWSEPSLSIHSLDVSGPGNETVIPATVKAKVSLRIVPDQELDVIARSLCDHISDSFKSIKSPNKIKISIDHTADWWLGNLRDPWFKALESAVRDVWGVEPLRIREGGSIPSVPSLEKEFGCHALHLPLGQSSDQAHLPNERISLQNLHKGKDVIERFLISVSEQEIVN
ncbi:Zn-dependent exopeptidase [Rickenella mellea]|uniref:Zn-dependent exopeptidase n=1 Tax=Rickenella mellea TaxID=50990 RepID=A0A4Y7Q8H9_9AGAM|nr:Zn-dependent exopeptidase [Rickenella mellea]